MRILFPGCNCGITWPRPFCVIFFFLFWRSWQSRNGNAARIKSYYKRGSFLCECSQSSWMIPLLLSIWFLMDQYPLQHQFQTLSPSQDPVSAPPFSVSVDKLLPYFARRAFLVAQTGKESACNAGDPGSIPGWGRSPGKGNGTHCSNACLENSMDRGAWWAESMRWQRVEDLSN